MESKVKKLLDACTEKIEKCSYWDLVKWSFRNDFKDLQDIPFGEVGESELKQFIKICDNRLDRSKTFLQDVSIVLGFDLTALSILAVMASKDNMFFSILPFSGIVTFASLFIILIFLLILLAHYRSQIHAWIAFKEKALM